MFLNQLNWNLARLDDTTEAGMSRQQVIKLFLEHRFHASCKRLESRVTQHGQLIFAVTIDQFCVAVEVQPILDVLIERTEQTAVVEGAPFEQFLRFEFSGRSEVL